MKFTTAIALTALVGNVAFSNALDVCNRDADNNPDYGEVCSKVCDKNIYSGIWNQVKIQCKIAESEVGIEGDGFVDCFNPQYTTGACKDVTVDIIYGYKNPMNKMDFKLIYGDYPDMNTSWMAFNETLQFDELLSDKTEILRRGKKFHNRKLENMKFNACEEIPVEMKMKNEAIPNSDDPNRSEDKKELWYTNRCGISGKILLCDDDCKKKWDATQGANPAPAPGPGPSAPATDPAPAPKPDAPRPSNPKSKEKGTKEPSAGKGSKQPTMKGKGTPVPEPVRRQMKNRKDARV